MSGICTVDNTGYANLIHGTCKGTQAFGLSVYINGNEMVTLDSTTTNAGLKTTVGKDISANPLQYSITRTANLFAAEYIPPAAGQTATNFQGIIDGYNAQYQTTLNQGFGVGKYMFVVPNDMTGKLGFSIAQEGSASNGRGSGKYSLQVLSTPSACFVNESGAMNQPGQRGALQLLISSANPNDVDNALSAFDSLATNEISIYYLQLLKYIAQTAGVVINSNAAVLGDLVTPKVPSLSPTVINGSYYSGTPNSSGNIWFKVRDDYYHDNVGQYEVYVNVITKTNSQASDFMQSLTVPIMKSLNTASTGIYYNFYNSSNFLQLVRVALLLYIILLGAQYTLGLTSISAYDLVIRVIKIAIVVQLFSPTSWAFFNTSLLQNSNYAK
jgi:hypothetical protein